MNKKFIGILAVIIVALIIAVPQYDSYQKTLLSQDFNKSLQNASSIETEIATTTKQINAQNSTDADTLITTINNDITPKYSEEILRLNETSTTTNNDVEKKYLDLQIKRVQLESENLNATVTTLNAISQYVKGEKTGADAQEAINLSNKAATNSSIELNQVYQDIKTLLNANPDLNKKVHDLNLDSTYYGQTQQQNITTNSTTQNTTAGTSQNTTNGTSQ